MLLFFYVGGVTLTALEMWLRLRPRTTGEHIAYLLAVLIWPLLWLYACYWAVRKMVP